MYSEDRSNQKPFVTVLMPIRNEADFIERSLGAILEQDYPHDRLEVLIADGQSTDKTRDLVRDLAAGTDCAVRTVDNPQRIVPTGFNLALAEAKGEIIVRVDGHTLIEPDYVRMCVDALERTGADNVGGAMNAIGSSIWGQAIALATSSPFGVGGARFHYSDQEEWVDTVYMGAWRREVFERLHGFDEELVRNQDDEFNYRLRASGGKILLDPRIRSRYFNRTTPRSLARQYYQYGFYKVRVMQKHLSQMRPRQFVPPLFVLTLIIGALLASFVPLVRYLWFLEVLLYAVANLAASWVTAKGNLRQLLYLPIVFLILHFSYGAGFLVGLVAFRRTWFQKA